MTTSPSQKALTSVVVIEVARTTLTLTDPVRTVTQYWTKDGRLLFEEDPCDQRQLVPVELPSFVSEALAKQEFIGDAVGARKLWRAAISLIREGH